MIPTHFSRPLQALVLVAVLATLAAPAVAVGGSSSGKAAPDVFERYAAAHPFGHGIVHSTPAPDVFERYAATHSTAVLTDGRSPDTRDAAEAARLQVVDRRTPDTLDAARAAQSVEVVEPGGFDWGDAGIGAIAAAMMLGLVGGSMLLLTRFHRHQRVQAT